MYFPLAFWPVYPSLAIALGRSFYPSWSSAVAAAELLVET